MSQIYTPKLSHSLKYYRFNEFNLYSLGLYSSWAFYKPLRSLFDCGEGFSLFHRNNIFAIKNIWLGHEHQDHIGGLLNLLATWTSARGDKEKVIRIFYPRSKRLEDLRIFANEISKAPVEWHAVTPGQIISFGDNIKVIPFKTNHTNCSVGYRIMECRKRLKKTLVGLTGAELSKIPASEKNEEYWHPKFVYALDNCGADWNGCEGADLIIQDCTFLKKEDRRGMTHNTLEECLTYNEQIKAKRTILAHISPRYGFADKEKARKILPQNMEMV